jgi:hypothetical protein
MAKRSTMSFTLFGLCLVLSLSILFVARMQSQLSLFYIVGQPTSHQSTTTSRMSITAMMHNHTHYNHTHNNTKALSLLFGENHRPVVILATDHHTPYLFYMPLLPWVWHHVMNHSVLIFTIGTEADWNQSPLLRYSLQQIRQAVSQSPGSYHLFVEHVPARQARSVAQTVRIFAPALAKIHPSVRLVTSDVDLWPMDSHWLDPNPGTDLVITNAFCCWAQSVANVTSRHYPICHISATARLWRQIMKYTTLVDGTTELVQLTTTSLESLFGKGSTTSHAIVRGGVGWDMDQTYISYRIAVTLNLSDDKITKRRLKIKQRQRLHGPELMALNRFLFKDAKDAHLPHYNGSDAWTLVRALLQYYHTTEEMQALDEYEATFRSLLLNHTEEE